MTQAPTMPASGSIHGQSKARGDVDAQAKRRNGDRLAEIDGHGREEAHDGFVADENGDQGEDDRGREAGEIAELASAEREARIVA